MLFDCTHKKKGTGEFVDAKSKKVSETYKAALTEKYGSEIDSQPSFDATMWVEAIGGVSKNKVYGFGLNAHSSSILMRTTISCSASQSDDLSGSASTAYFAAPGAMKMTQEHIMVALMNPQYKEMLRSLISSLGFTSSEQLSSPPQEKIQSAVPPVDPPCD
ncbi:uncharacterized protein [Elaeis guineensis]|uniref:uncharacterized protein n=1 Tax=Elaeis guineensis var. tenera TaxID=51953 RepID=UPI003C6D40FB